LLAAAFSLLRKFEVRIVRSVMHRRWLGTAALLLALLLLGFSPAGAWAQGSHGAGEEPDIFKPRFDLGIWSLIVFAVLLLVLRRLAWRPMLSGLQKREEFYHGRLEEARLAHEEAQRVQRELQIQLDRTQERVREIYDEARQQAQRTTDEMIAAARTEIQTERDRLRREIDMARDQALQELWNQAAQLATLISAKAIRRELNLEDHRRLVDEAIAELRPAGHQRQRELASVKS
jgi:F-type H+-transporting ATPase subunit b